MTVPVSDLIGAAPTATGGVAKAGAYDVAEGDPGARKVEFAAPAPSRRLQKNSAVLLLADMLRPEGVDEDLEGDIAEECSKSGSVESCRVFVSQDPDVPAEHAVRVFVKFKTPEGAAKALMDLDGRFFDGRVLRASYFSEDRFRSGRFEFADD